MLLGNCWVSTVWTFGSRGCIFSKLPCRYKKNNPPQLCLDVKLWLGNCWASTVWTISFCTHIFSKRTSKFPSCYKKNGQLTIQQMHAKLPGKPMYPHITFQLHDRERGKLWRLIENAEVGQACGLAGSIQPRWLMGRFLVHLVCQRRIICQDQDCEFRSLRSLRVAFPLQSNPALWNVVSFNTASNLQSIWPLQSSESNCKPLLSFHFFPGSRLKYWKHKCLQISANWDEKATAPTSPAKLVL